MYIFYAKVHFENSGGAYGEYGNDGFSGGLGRYTDFADSGDGNDCWFRLFIRGGISET